MLKLKTRIFAGHYQFYIHDSESNHYEDSRLDWGNSEKLNFGYMASEEAIFVLTNADLNDHCVHLF